MARGKVLEVGDVLVGIDPGRTTGVCSAVYTGAFNLHVTHAFDLGWDDRFMLDDWVEIAKHIIVEDFRLYANKAEDQINNDFPSVLVKGAVEAFAWKRGKLDGIVYQMASERTEVQILDHHTYMFKGLHHARDAYKHVRKFVVMQHNARRQWERMEKKREEA